MILKYSQIRPTLQLGDLILFSANFLLSDIIKEITDSPFSHVGMVAKYPGVDELCFWEATTEGQFECVIDHRPHAGVHLISLDALLQFYAPYTENNFIFRRLETARNQVMEDAFVAFAQRVDGDEFDETLALFVNWIIGKISPIPTGEKSFACSQLVADTYQRLGLLPIHPTANSYAPKSFSMQNTNLPLLSGATLSEEIMVLWDGPAGDEITKQTI